MVFDAAIAACAARSWERSAGGFVTSQPERKKARETKALILDVARQMFASEGYEGTSVRQVAERCRISDAALFHYFSSKQALYRAVLPGLVLQDDWDRFETVEELVAGLLERRRRWQRDPSDIALVTALPVHPDTDRIAQRLAMIQRFRDGVSSVLLRLGYSDPPLVAEAVRLVIYGTGYDAVLRFGAAYGQRAFAPDFVNRLELVLKLVLGLELPEGPLGSFYPAPAPVTENDSGRWPEPNPASPAVVHRQTVDPSRRSAILDAALRQFADAGFEQTTMRHIGDGCGISDAAIYHHFASKAALRDAIILERRPLPFVIEGERQELPQPLTSSGVAAIGEDLLRYLSEYRLWIRLSAREAHRGALARNLLSALWHDARRVVAGEMERSAPAGVVDLLGDAFMRLMAGLSAQLRLASADGWLPAALDPAQRIRLTQLAAVVVPLDRWSGRRALRLGA